MLPVLLKLPFVAASKLISSAAAVPRSSDFISFFSAFGLEKLLVHFASLHFFFISKGSELIMECMKVQSFFEKIGNVHELEFIVKI